MAPKKDPKAPVKKEAPAKKAEPAPAPAAAPEPAPAPKPAAVDLSAVKVPLEHENEIIGSDGELRAGVKL